MIEKFKKLTITQTLVIGFLTLVMIGGTLLSLPISSQSGTWTDLGDAFFTATSAICVTGQTVVNTARHWSWFGKLVILILVQIGGLGFMSLILSFFFLIGKRINLRQQKIAMEALGLDHISESKSLVWYVVTFSLTVQAIGAVLLSFQFIPDLGVKKGIIYSVFHSVSAFCNAGFDLFGDSFQGYREHPYVLTVIMLLIIFGGLGFVVWRDIQQFRTRKRLLLHTRLVLRATGIILLVSFILLLISETSYGTFEDLSPIDQTVNIAFLAVTPRTAGYSTIEYYHVSLAGRIITYILMFMGGSSGSTAGGFKVTTLAVLWLYFRAIIQGREPTFQNRSIPLERIRGALFLLVMSLMLIMGALILLAITQEFPDVYGMDSLFMEVLSCFGTTGLTMGLIDHFNLFGKIILMSLMFIGRVGMVTVIWSFKRDDRESQVRYPEGNILIG